MSAYSIVNLKEDVEDSLRERVPGMEGVLRASASSPSTWAFPIRGMAQVSAHLRRIATANRRRPTSS